MRFKTFVSVLPLLLFVGFLSACRLVGDATVYVDNDGSGSAEVLFFKEFSNDAARSYFERIIKSEFGEGIKGRYHFFQRDERLGLAV